MADRMFPKINRTGLTVEDAKQLHGVCMRGVLLWLAISLFAHLLAWAWMPWLFA